MSRSRRKTPIFGMTNCRSEYQDKRIWHGRLRAQARTKLATLVVDEFDGAVIPEVRDVSNPWSMGKDGKLWISQETRSTLADHVADRKSRGQQERLSIFRRNLRKWMVK